MSGHGRPRARSTARSAALDDLVEVGISAVEVMPVAQFPGRRNWGYDGVFPFAVQNSYGGAAGLQRFVDACHQRGLDVILDVVYNHLGPEGNMLDAFGPYFTDRYRTPWGPAVNFDGAGSNDVRAYFLQNARQWFTDFHIDGLRLDAVHEIIDRSAVPFLADLAAWSPATSAAGSSSPRAPTTTRAWSPRSVREESAWTPSGTTTSITPLHAAITGERTGYYLDFGPVERHRTGDGRGLRLPGRVLGIPPTSTMADRRWPLRRSASSSLPRITTTSATAPKVTGW